MSRIIWRRRGVEWVGRLTKDGPDRFGVRKVVSFGRVRWLITDERTCRKGLYDRLREAKSAAETMR